MDHLGVGGRSKRDGQCVVFGGSGWWFGSPAVRVVVVWPWFPASAASWVLRVGFVCLWSSVPGSGNGTVENGKSVQVGDLVVY